MVFDPRSFSDRELSTLEAGLARQTKDRSLPFATVMSRAKVQYITVHTRMYATALFHVYKYIPNVNGRLASLSVTEGKQSAPCRLASVLLKVKDQAAVFR
jgi:hypothetical protein